ncbi:CDP-diacylglycerol--serine O-phosphatidyltransferase [Hufsiella ginkgonis]|uniref:CDP-diacylglycerol--serine O-phosphatidyltransferase n=1 Tax=Hufsiella ginkgonis TaxID=2695274 RepID=A0A7K1XWK3_9SPHI|nr:CDP-diacylglycerol--serine O-phosphatidyltransferase [Hufsiella ginkgonis]MXV15383.1 CDP-diacylglycerol--serine O-phosphatidyltransferase [Hufsiella ginkgonis]
MKKHVPNALSCLNLFSGCVGIVLAFQDQLVYAGFIIILATIIDFFDGLTARLLKAYSETGEQLDSLADIVSFGILPSVIIYQLFLRSPSLGTVSTFLNFSAFLIAVFSALRLAKFNIDPRQTDNFIGLPTPANALVIASLPGISEANVTLSNYILNPFFLFVFTLGMGLLLIAEIPLMSLKFRSKKLDDNLFRYILLISGSILILIFKFTAFPMIFFIYVGLSLVQFKVVK